MGRECNNSLHGIAAGLVTDVINGPKSVTCVCGWGVMTITYELSDL